MAILRIGEREEEYQIALIQEKNGDVLVVSRQGDSEQRLLRIRANDKIIERMSYNSHGFKED